MKQFTLLLVIFFITIHVNNIIVLCSLTPEQTTSNYNSTKSSTLKTSRSNYGRTIHRMIGGHVQYSNGNIGNETSARNETLPVPAAQFRRKMISSRYRNSPLKNIQLHENNNIEESDFGLLTSSAGNGRDEEPKEAKKSESKKTLADQVAEGKYGLIQTELFQNEPKRPGIISYKANPEVPNDDSSNYGGLDEDDIWLAEDHLLILKGGTTNKDNNQIPWKPIDDYEAPQRQVKLPLNPKVPPPFPVQLTDNGPIQFIGNNQFPVFNPFTNESIFLFTNEGFPKAQADDNDKKNLFTGYGKTKNNTQYNGYQYPPPVPPPAYVNNNQTFSNPFLNLPPLPQFPNGSFDEQNITQPFDEDDPTLYYPPPYSFEYKSNYSNPVSPGPLVPGIILPPPPSFFEPLEEAKKPVKTPLDVLNTIQNIKLREKLTTSTIRPKTRPTTTQSPEAQFIEIQKVKVKTFVPHDIRENVVLKPVPPTRYYGSTTTTTPSTTTLRTRPTTKPTTPTTTLRSRTILKKIPSPPQLSYIPNSNNDNFGKGNPIYFEYFDARTPAPIPYSIFSSPITTPSPIEISSTSEYIEHTKPITPRPIFKQHVSTPIYDDHNYNKNFPSNTYLPIKNSDYDKYLYITPKPDIKPNGITNNYIPISGIQTLALKPVQPFEKEVETIRETLRFYQHPESTRSPKAKAVYEYSFDASQNNASPVEMDKNPFRPMLPYSVPYKSQYSTSLPLQRVKEGKYLRTTTYRAPPKNNYYNQAPSLSTQKPYKQRPQYEDVTEKYYNYNQYGQKIQPVDNHEYSTVTTTRPILKNQPWYTIEKHIVKEIVSPNPVSYDNYNYERPVIYNNGASGFNQNDGYIKQITQIKEQLQRYPVNNTYARPYYNSDYDTNTGYYQPPQPQPQPQRSQGRLPQKKYQTEIPLNKDVLVNYKYPLPPVNPDSELLPYNPNYRRYLDNPVIQYRLPGDRAHVFFIPPQEFKQYNKK